MTLPTSLYCNSNCEIYGEVGVAVGVCVEVGVAVDVDLSSIAGKNVQFALAVLANGVSDQDWAVWVRPEVILP